MERERKYWEWYMGLTYPLLIPFYGWPEWALSLWRRFMCSRHRHLFDETASYEGHYLHCDACQLMVHISFIETTYCTPKEPATPGEK